MPDSLTPLCPHVVVGRSHPAGGYGDAWDHAWLQVGGQTISMESPVARHDTGRLSGSIEWLCDEVGVIRCHERGGHKGDPFTGLLLLERRPADPTCGYLSVTSRAPTVQEFRAICHVLRLAGFSYRDHERRHHGKLKRVRRRL